MKAAVIGYPLHKTRSPRIHSYWMRKYFVAGNYEAMRIAPEMLDEMLVRMHAENYSGFNVTAPYKREIFLKCAALDDDAKTIGAVNTVVIDPKSGALKGYNTDAYGFVASIEKTISSYKFKGKTAFVIGAGGAARAIIHALKDKECANIKITNRTQSKAQNLSNEFSLEHIDWEERHSALDDVDLLINATSLGAQGNDDLELDLTGLSRSSLIYDIVYTPLETKLIHDGKMRGNKTMGGIHMLLHQAALAFYHWSGIMPEVDDAVIMHALAD